MRFPFIANHRHIWPVSWLCEVLDVSRSGFHAWLNRPASTREIHDAKLVTAIETSFKASDRTYGGCVQRQGGGQNSRRSIKAKETHADRQQGRQRNPRHECPAARSRRVPAPAGATCGMLVGHRVHDRGRFQTPAAHRGDKVHGGERRMRAVPTEVIGRLSVEIVVLSESDQFAIRFTPKCGWSGKSRPEGRMTSIHGAPARLRA